MHFYLASKSADTTYFYTGDMLTRSFSLASRFQTKLFCQLKTFKDLEKRIMLIVQKIEKEIRYSALDELRVFSLKSFFLFIAETLVCDACVDKISNSWQDDYDDVVLSLLSDKQPSYLIYQLGSHNEWLLLTFSPDDAPVSRILFFPLVNQLLKFCHTSTIGHYHENFIFIFLLDG